MHKLRRKKMHKLIRLFLICASVSVLFGSLSALAQVDRSLEGDQKCTLCHNESWSTPILTIYQTKHGVKADERTPGCQSCHGASASHLGDPTTKAGCRVWRQIQKYFVGSGAECILSHLSRIKRPCSVALGGQPARKARSCLHRLSRSARGKAESAGPGDPAPSLR